MIVAIWIIAACEIIRTVQITVDLIVGTKHRKKFNNQIVESLKDDNKKWAKDMLEEFLEIEMEGKE